MTHEVKNILPGTVLSLALIFSGCGAVSAAAQDGVESEEIEPGLPTPSGRIDELFDKLQNAPAGRAAKGVEETIMSVFSQSGSATADLLMDRAASAVLDDDLDLGLSLLNRVIELQPGFAESYHRRAQTHFLKEDYAQAMADLQQVLRLEPRHFLALRSVGFVLLETGDMVGAMKAFGMALELNPHMEDVIKALSQLTPRVEGRGI